MMQNHAAAQQLAPQSVEDIAQRANALEAAGVEFIDENGGGPGVRLAKRRVKKS